MTDFEYKSQGFKAKAKIIAEELKKRDNFAIIHHYDADGISAGAIIAKAFQRLGKTFKTKSVKQLYRETIEEIKDMGENYVFVDFGSALIDELKESFGNNFFVLDHHQPKGSDYEFHLNPFEFGINGGDEISGSGVTYEVVKHLGDNSDLSALAIVGALGDMQDFKGSLIGKNREIMAEAIKSNVLEVRKDLRLYGRISRPLTQFLCFSSNPVLPELTANESACVDFLKTHDLDIRDNGRWVSYDDLSSENKKKLTTALILHLQSYNTPEWKLRELIGDVFILKNELAKTPLRDAKEFSTLLNSCGRHGEAETALQVCMGDRDEYYSRALSLLAEHRRQLRTGIEFMTEKGVDEMETFYFFDAGSEIKDSIVGIVAGMLYGSGAINGDKPIVAFAMHEDNTIKISTRGTSELLRKGLNLGLALKETCAKLGDIAQGGGHKIAAGAKINENQKEDFLKIFNESLKNQITD